VCSTSHVIDVRLQKVVAFGDRAGAVRPLSLKNRDEFHRAEWAAKANWDRDIQTKELPPDGQHRRPRWRVKLNGTFQRDPKVELCPSYEEPGVSMAIMVCNLLNLCGDPGSTDVPHSTLWASFHFARPSFTLIESRTKSLLWARFISRSRKKHPRHLLLENFPHRFATALRSSPFFCISFLGSMVDITTTIFIFIFLVNFLGLIGLFIILFWHLYCSLSRTGYTYVIQASCTCTIMMQ
jgi:hypothetical protein